MLCCFEKCRKSRKNGRDVKGDSNEPISPENLNIDDHSSESESEEITIINQPETGTLKIILPSKLINELNTNSISKEKPSGLEEEEIGKWLVSFLPQLKRTTTRTEKCRLIAAMERIHFKSGNPNIKGDDYSFFWQFCRLNKITGRIYYNQHVLTDFEINATQKMILDKEPSLENQLISRWEIKEEYGDWELTEALAEKLMSYGGEAIIFKETFGDLDTAVRIHAFDPFLFTDNIDLDSLSWKIHLAKNFEVAKNDATSEKQNQMPAHKNLIKNMANIELFYKTDSKQEDCVGWLTIMEKAEEDLRTLLRHDKLDITERKRIANEIYRGCKYFNEIGLLHYDLKLENILLLNGIPKIIDFGLVSDKTGREGYRQMGYSRRGSRYRVNNALAAGSPGFTQQAQLTSGEGGEKISNLWYFLFCDWKTAWTLLYAPISESEKEKIDEIVKRCNGFSIHTIKKGEFQILNEISEIICLDKIDSSLCLDDPYLTKSYHMSSLKNNATKCANQKMQNLTRDILDQKSSKLCAPLSVTTLLRHALKNDLNFTDLFCGEMETHTFEDILSSLTMIIYPRSMFGLNLNPNIDEQENQMNDIELLLRRLCQKTYLMESGWEIIRRLGFETNRPKDSICKYERVLLDENFVFTRPVTVTGVWVFPDGTVGCHQMTMDRVENDEYVLQNTEFSVDSPVVKISKFTRYFKKQNIVMGIVQREVLNENVQFETWYLLDEAFTLSLIPTESTVNEPSENLQISPTNDIKDKAEELLYQIQAMGFEKQAIFSLVSLCNGDFVMAVDLLLRIKEEKK